MLDFTFLISRSSSVLHVESRRRRERSTGFGPTASTEREGDRERELWRRRRARPSRRCRERSTGFGLTGYGDQERGDWPDWVVRGSLSPDRRRREVSGERRDVR
jgi:hypothetical protein